MTQNPKFNRLSSWFICKNCFKLYLNYFLSVSNFSFKSKVKNHLNSLMVNFYFRKFKYRPANTATDIIDTYCGVCFTFMIPLATEVRLNNSGQQKR